jgi:ADP-ribose diphosphatase
MKTARVIAKRQVYSGKVFGVRRDVVIEPGGLRVTRDIVTHLGSVVVLPVFPDGSILLVRQYRHAVARSLWELTAGRMEAGETLRAAAQRELAEETGYAAGRLERLMEIYPTPGFVSERMILFTARDLRKKRLPPDEDERIFKRRFRPEQLLRMIRAGRLRDAKTAAGLLYYFTFRASRGARGRKRGG